LIEIGPRALACSFAKTQNHVGGGEFVTQHSLTP
jgi:hypothetical protein